MNDGVKMRLFYMLLSDVFIVAGAFLLMRPADPTKLISPLHLIGWLLLAGGIVASVYNTAIFIRERLRERN